MPEIESSGSCQTCTVGWKTFIHLTKDQLAFVNGNRYEAGFKSGELMMKQGAPSSNVLFLSAGMAKVYIESPGGRNFIVNIAKPGEMILGPGAYVNSRHTYSVSSITPVKACFISFDVFRKLATENAAFADGLLEDLSLKSLKVNERLITLAHKRMPGRLADALIYFSNEVFDSEEFDVLLSRQELGDFTNMAKECVVRIIKEFEEAGLIVSNGSVIKIIDREAIIKISEKG